MIEGVILAIVIVIAFGIIALPFIWNFLVDKNSFSNIDLSKAALYISFVVIVSIILATAFKINSAIDINKGADFIVKAIVPLATIAGFYMVYQTFIVQSENSLKQEVHDLIKLQNRILGEIVLTEVKIDRKFTEPKGDDDDEKERINYTGRSAFKKIIYDFNNSFKGNQERWNAYILKSIEVHSIDPNIKTKATEYIKSLFEDDNYDEKKTLEFIKKNYSIFQEKIITDDFFKKLNYEEFLASTLYVQIYFDESTGTNFLKEKFNFKSINLVNYFTKYFDYFETPPEIKFNLIKDGYNYENIFFPKINSPQIQDLLKNYYNRQLLQKLNRFYSEDFFKKSIENSQDLNLFLDTYFRNLFNAYRTVKNFKSKKIREDSARLLRTQISSYEQAVIFLNSLTPMGAEWQKVGDLDLFKELNTIKNIPENVLTHIQPWDVYPIEKGFKYKYKSAT